MDSLNIELNKNIDNALLLQIVKHINVDLDWLHFLYIQNKNQAKVEVLKRLREQWKAMEVFMSQFPATLFSGTYRWVSQFILGSFYSWGVNILSHVEYYRLGLLELDGESLEVEDLQISIFFTFCKKWVTSSPLCGYKGVSKTTWNGL